MLDWENGRHVSIGGRTFTYPAFAELIGSSWTWKRDGEPEGCYQSRAKVRAESLNDIAHRLAKALGVGCVTTSIRYSASEASVSYTAPEGQ